MERTRRVARRARARQMGGALATRAGVWLTAAAGAAVGLVGLDKVFNLVQPWWVLVAGPLAVGAAAAALVTMARRRTLLDGAAEVDRRLGLKDRLATAVALGAPGGAARGDDPFVALAVADAEDAAARVDVKKAVPVRLRWHWGAWPVLAGLAVVGGVLLPTWDVLSEGPREREVAAREAEQRQRAAAEVRDAVELARKALPEKTAEAATTRELEQLRQLQSELESGQKDAGTAREASARTMEQMAAKLDDQAESARMEADATRRRLAETAGGTGDGESSLTRAVRQGDLAAAREAAKSLMSGLGDLSAEEREKLAKDLEQMSRDLKELDERAAREKEFEPKSAAREGEPRSAPAGSGDQRAGDGAKPPDPTVAPDVRRDLESQGLAPNQVSELARAPDKTAAQKRMEDLGVDPETARRLAERMQQDHAEQKADEQARKNAEELSKAMDETADALREPPPSESPEGEKPPPSQAQKPGERPRDGNPPARQGEKSGERRQGDQAQRGEGQKGATGKGEKGERQDGVSRPSDGTGKEGQAREGQPSDKPEATRPGGQPSETRQGDKQGDGKQGEGQRPASGERSGQKPGAGDKPSGVTKPDAERGDGPGGDKQSADKQSGDKSGGEKQGAEGQPQPGDKPVQGEHAGDKTAGEKPSGDKTGGQDGSKPQPGDKTGERAGEKPSGDARPSEAAGQDPAKPGDRAAPQSGDKQDGAPDKTAPPGGQSQDGARRGDKPAADKPAGEPKPGDQRQPGAGDKRGTSPSAPGDKPGGTEAPSDRSGKTPKPDAAGKAGSQDKQVKPEASRDGQGGTKEQPGASGDNAESQQAEKGAGEQGEKPGEGPPDAKAVERLLEKLKDMDGARDKAERNERVARDLRERAREMLEKATPEQRERLERWAEQFAKERGLDKPAPSDRPDASRGGPNAGSQPGNQRNAGPRTSEPPSRTDLVDARPRDRSGKSGDERVVGERTSDGKAGPDAATAVSREQVDEALGHAKESAERAVTERLVPGRYDQLLRKYFDRLPAKAPGPAPAPETAKDADPGKK